MSEPETQLIPRIEPECTGIVVRQLRRRIREERVDTSRARTIDRAILALLAALTVVCVGLAAWLYVSTTSDIHVCTPGMRVTDGECR